MQEFSDQADESRSDRVVIVAAGYPKPSVARKAAAAYKTALKGIGWPKVSTNVVDVVHERDAVTPELVSEAAGVVFVDGDRALLQPAVSDPAFADTVREAADTATVTLTAGMGEWYASAPNPTSAGLEDAGIADFKVGHAALRPGLGVVDGVTVEPRLTADYRWGRLFDAAQAHPSTLAVGVSELTALDLGGAAPGVVGERSVTVLDGRHATFVASDNDTAAVANALLSTYGPGAKLP